VPIAGAARRAQPPGVEQRSASVFGGFVGRLVVSAQDSEFLPATTSAGVREIETFRLALQTSQSADVKKLCAKDGR